MRRLFAVLALLACALVLTGCPKKEGLRENPEGEQQPDPGPKDPRPN